MGRDINELREMFGKPIKEGLNPISSQKKDLNELRKLFGKPQIQESPKENPEEYTYGERAAQLGHGLAKGIGSAIETVSNIMPGPAQVNKMTLKMLSERSGKSPEELISEMPALGVGKMEVAKPLTEAVESLAGRSLEPSKEDLTGRIIHGTGEFLTPLPGMGLGKAAQAGVKGLGKLLGREAATAAGASTALEAKPKFTEEGTVGRSVEDLADMILGGRAAGKLTGKSAKIIDDIYKGKKEGRILESIKEYPTKKAAHLVARFSKPDLKSLKLAEEYGIDLPVNVGARNTALNWIHNNFLKSTFSSKAYKDVFNKADEQMYNKFKDSIDTLGLENVEPVKASGQFRDFLKEERKSINEEVENLYNDAVLKSGKSDKVVPEHTINDIHTMKSILDRDIQAPDTLKVSKVIGKLADSWGLLPKDDSVIQLKKEGYDDPKLLSKILAQIPKKSIELPNIEIGRLNEVRQELGQMIYDEDLRGMRGFLSKLRDSVTRDIESTKNPEFLDKWKKANKFYYDNVASRIESDLAHSMLTGEAPKEAFDAMNSVKGIKLIEKISGSTEKGKRVLNDLKKAKLRDIFKNSIEGSYEEGRLKKAPFAKIFQKGEKNQELIKELVGADEYKKLSDIATIADEFSQSGKELLNTSGTAFVTADIDRIQGVAKNAIKLLMTFGGYSAAGAPGALAGASATAAAPWLLSKLMANPTFVRESRIYALQRQAGKEKEARKTLNRLLKISDSEARRSAIQLNKILNQKEKPEENVNEEQLT